MKSFVVVTPTYNRARQLVRLYDSLVAQTLSYDLFDWFVVDDGSTDNTADLINDLISVAPFKIIYHRKENGGKHTAWKYAVDILSGSAEYNYFVSIDSDDVLTEDALEVFLYHWKDINDNSENVNVLNARTKLADGIDQPHKIYGDNDFIEDTYQNVTLKMGEQSEMITSFKVKDLDVYLNIPDKFWLSDKVKFFSENIIWARNGRMTRSRYIKKYLRLVYRDAGNQISHNAKKGRVDHLYNYIVGYKYFLSENADVIFRYQKKSLVIDLIKYGAMCVLVGIPVREAYNELESKLLRFLYVVLFPFSILVVIAFNIRKLF